MSEASDERFADHGGMASPEELADHDEARLVGRLSGAPDRRTLPSGDEIVSLRMVVRRPGGGSDTLPVQFGPAPPSGRRRGVGQVGRRALAAVDRLEDGTRIEVLGAVRRRWWGGPDGRRSRIEVLAEVVRPAAEPSGSRPFGLRRRGESWARRV